MESHWFVAKGLSTNWIWSKKPCEVRNDMMDEANVIVIGEKEFFNDNGVLVVDMMYTVNQIGDKDGSAGIVFYFDDTNCDNFYYVGIWPAFSWLFIGEYINGNWSLLDYKSIRYRICV